MSAYFDQVESSLPFDGYHHFVVNGNFSSVTGGVYHHGGRAYPDVSAVGDRQVVYQNGSWWLVGGTSLSSPIWGAVLTLVNEARLAAGKSTIGFIHPILVSLLWSSLLIEELLTEACSTHTLKHLTISLMEATLAATHLVSLLLQVGIPSLDWGKHQPTPQNLGFKLTVVAHQIFRYCWMFSWLPSISLSKQEMPDVQGSAGQVQYMEFVIF